MARITASDVFNFMGTPDDLSDANEDLVNALIPQFYTSIESYLGRKIEVTEFTGVYAQDGINCHIIDNSLYLLGEYRDLLEVTSLYIDDEEIEQVEDITIDEGYCFELGSGIIELNTLSFPKGPKRIRMSGSIGIVNSSGETPADIELVLIESVAVKSGLWVVSINGQEVLRNELSDEAKKVLSHYKL